jgi:hypothetical protein
MTARLRTAALAVAAAAGLLVAPIALAGSAVAAEPNTAQVLFFSSDQYTDPDDEDATQIAALQEGGATVTVFDGGDGTGAAWSAALAGKHFLVIPESGSIFDEPILDDAAEDVLFAFVNGGGHLILPTDYQAPLLSFLTGLDYTSVWATDDAEAPGELAIEEPGLPAQVLPSDGTYPVVNPQAWTPEMLDAMTPLYVSQDGTELHSAQWTVGAGTITVLAYDWFPGDEPEDIAGRATWNALLQWLTYIPAVPQLAATGAEAPAAPAFAAFGLLLLGAVLVVARSRRVVRA